MWIRTTLPVGSKGGGRRAPMAAGSLRYASVSTSAFRKANGKGGTSGASHGVEKPPATISSRVGLFREPLKVFHLSSAQLLRSCWNPTLLAASSKLSSASLLS